MATLTPIWSASWCGDTLLGVGEDGLSWWDGRTGAALATERPVRKPGLVACSPDGKRALVRALDNYGIELWDVDHREGRMLLDSSHRVGAIAWAPDSHRLALGRDGGLEVWRMKEGNPVLLARRRSAGGALAWRPDGQVIAAEAPARFRVSPMGDRPLAALQAQNLSRHSWLYD